MVASPSERVGEDQLLRTYQVDTTDSGEEVASAFDVFFPDVRVAIMAKHIHAAMLEMFGEGSPGWNDVLPLEERVLCAVMAYRSSWDASLEACTFRGEMSTGDERPLDPRGLMQARFGAQVVKPPVPTPVWTGGLVA